MKIILPFCVLLLALSTSCSSPKPKETELTGEIFIATRGRENLKLGAVTVNVIPLIKTEDYIAGKKVADSGKNMTSSWYFRDLPSSIAQTTTNSEGKFVLNLPYGEYALVATASRRIIEETENYYWLVRVSATKEKQTIILSNVNLTSANSPESMFKADAPNSPD